MGTRYIHFEDSTEYLATDIEFGTNWSKKRGDFPLGTKMQAIVFPAPMQPVQTQVWVAEIRTRWFENGPGISGAFWSNIATGGYGFTFKVRFREKVPGGMKCVLVVWWD